MVCSKGPGRRSAVCSAALAQRIVETRNSGRFTSADDLLRVPGIGKAKLAKLRDYVEVD